MAFDAGSIVAKLALNSSGFSAGVAGAIASANALKATVLSLAAPLAAIAGIGGLGMMVHSASESIDAIAKLSDRLGMTTQTLVAMQHAGDLAGVSAEEMTQAFERMLNVAGEAASKGGEAAKALEAVGISASRMQGMAPDQMFEEIAQSLAEVQDPFRRAEAAMNIFGRAGQRLLPMMMAGKAGIAAAKEEAEKLGISFSRVDAAKVEAANDSLTRVQKVFQGLAQTAVIELAPYVDGLAKKFIEVATAGGGIGPTIVSAIGSVLEVVAKASDYVALLQSGWQLLRYVAAEALSGVLDAIGLVIQGVEWLAQKLGAAQSQMGTYTRLIAQELHAEAAAAFAAAGESWDAFASGKNARAVQRFLADVRSGAHAAAQAVGDGSSRMSSGLGAVAGNLEKVTEKLRDLRAEVQQFGLSDAGKLLEELKALGASDAQMAEAKGLLAQLQAMQQRETAVKADMDHFLDLSREAEQMTNELMTPLEKMQLAVARAGVLLDKGLITPDLYDRAYVAAEQALADATKKTQTSGSNNGLTPLINGRAAIETYRAEIALLGRGSDDIPRRQLHTQEQMLGQMTKLANRPVAVYGTDTK